MRKAMLLGAPLAALVMAWSATAAHAQDPFKDLDKNHWAYQAVIDLQQKGILLGYPGDYFKGKRTLTRYEFAIAIRRLLDKLPASTPGPAGADGAAGPPGPQGPPGMTPEEIATIQRLVDEFKTDLANLGVQVKNIQSRLDALSKDVQDIKDRLDRMPTISGDFFAGFRADRSRDAFVDYGGSLRAASSSMFQNVQSPNDFHLGIFAKLSGGVTFTGDIVASNYLTYRGGSLSGTATSGTNKNLEEINLYQAHVDVPLTEFGSNTVLTLGRYKEQVTPLTYWRPDYDPYFDLPWYDDGNYVQDGFKLTSKFGSATTTLFGASFTGLGGANGGINTPVIGSSAGLPGFGLGGLPAGNLLLGPFNGIPATQTAGLHVGIPIMRAGELGLTAIDLSGPGLSSAAGGSGPVGGGPGYNNLVVYGANFTAHAIGRFKIDGEVAKSVTQAGFVNIDGLPNDDNNAYRLNVGWGSHGLDVHAGYNYFDPRFSAPGYWLKIGDWYNPTNVQGPFAEIAYNLTHALKLDIRGDFLSGARNRPGGDGGGYDLTKGSDLMRGKVGLAYKLNKVVNLTADYEGVFYDLSIPGAARVKPNEQYITVGTGLNLTGNTVLKLAYQIISYNELGAFSPTNTSNAGVFTTQVAVHF